VAELTEDEMWDLWLKSGGDIYLYADLVAEKERDACIEVVMKGTGEPVQTRTLEIINQERERIVDAIRRQND
jgi:hypothetical protein